jgi:glycerol-3-phosphate O-acyltransferase
LPPILPHIVPNIKDWPINIFSDERKKFIFRLNERVIKQLSEKYEGRLDELLNKAIYLEKKRVKYNPWKVDPSDDKTIWTELGKEVGLALNRSDKDEALQQILMRIINRYNEEIVGGFKIKTFRFARRFLTTLYKKIYNPFSKKGQRIFWGRRKDLLKRLYIDGHVEATRSLFKKGTVVIVPTHFSNLDSIMLGYVIDQVAGLPAFIYGAGLNLYDYEIPAYFMNRLGAYRVDRRKKNPIYLACLTSMASQSLHSQVNNIFFPGGTRSRSGAMEGKLKLGLLGSVIDAQRDIIINEENNKIFIVPVTMGYHFIFEAKSLVEQHLRAIGKEKYTRSKENQAGGFSFKFLKKFFTEESEFYMTFGEPMDVLGNRVDKQGNSLDKNGRTVDLKDYFKTEGQLSENQQRESVYARHLGSRILENYFTNNLIITSHLIAYFAFKIIEKLYQEEDLFSLLRIPSKNIQIDLNYFKDRLAEFIIYLKDLEKNSKVRLHLKLHEGISTILNDGLNYLGVYHTQNVLYIDKDDLKTENLRLLYFYHNRLEGYGFEKFFQSSNINP